MQKLTRRLILLMLLTVLTACECLAEFTDTDWNLTFYDNCGFPVTDGEYQSVKWVTNGKNKFLRFELRNGDKGKCSSDDVKRNRAPYWERAEVKQKFILERKKYSLEFEVRFVSGFQGERETFFQIHQYHSGCSVGPPLMFKAFSQGMLGVFLKQPEGQHFRHFVGPLDIGEWIRFKLIFNTAGDSEVSLYKNKRIHFEGQPFHIKDCGEPHFKFGIYRPGDDEFGGNTTSIVDFDKFELKVIN